MWSLMRIYLIRLLAAVIKAVGSLKNPISTAAHIAEITANHLIWNFTSTLRVTDRIPGEATTPPSAAAFAYSIGPFDSL